MKQNNRNLISQYIGFATQLLLTLGVALFGGYLIDKKWFINNSIFTILLPLLVIIVFLYKTIKDTSSKK